MKTRQLGRNGPHVSQVGLGCMTLSGVYGGQADEKEGIATIQAALDAGITLFDTGDFYAMGHNESLLGSALKGRRDQAFVQVKFGVQRDPAQRHLGYDVRPNSIRNFISYSLQRLKTDYIDLYQPARVDPEVPIEDVVGTVADLIKAGYVRYIGLSEADGDTLRRAHAVHPIAALQTEYSLIARGIEREVLPVCRELGIGLVPYGVLSRGLLSGNVTPDRLAADKTDIRARFPRFQGENLTRNLTLAAQLAKIAERRGATPAELAIAWVAGRGEDIVPLVGARNRAQLGALTGAFDLRLTPAEYEEIENAVPVAAVAGDRYDARSSGRLVK